MAQVQESNKGGKRNLNPEVNLVPFIDLLSVCICFLLMTAVWLQIGSVKVMQSLGEEAQTPPTENYELAVKLLDVNRVSVELKKGQKSAGTFEVSGANQEEFMTKLFAQVDGVIAKVKQEKGEQAQPPIASATVVPNDKVNYGNMIAVMDVLRKREIVNLGVMPRM